MEGAPSAATCNATVVPPFAPARRRTSFTPAVAFASTLTFVRVSPAACVAPTRASAGD